MKNFTIKPTSLLAWILVGFLIVLGSPPTTQAQTISTTSQFTANNGYGGTVFNFENTNSYPVMIDALESQGITAGDVVYKLFYNLTPVSGQPTSAIVTDPNWVEAHAQVTNYTTANTQQEVMNNIGLEIPANTTVGLAVLGFLGNDVNNPGSGHQSYFSIVAGSGTITFSDAGCSIIAGENISYGFTTYNTTSYFHPRGFVGSISFFPVSQTPCTGTPDAGTIAGVTEICPTLNFTLNTPYPQEADIVLQWQSSPSGQNNWSDIVGATSANYNNIAGINNDTDYRLISTCTNTNLSDTTAIHTVNISPAIDCFCTPIYLYGCNIGARVDGVTTTMGATNIVNTGTGCNELNAMGYTDYSATHQATAAQATPINIQVDVSNYSGGVKVWVDWNQNGVFEASELVTESPGIVTSGNSHIGTFTVPNNATVGLTKMRVRVVESSTVFDACSQANYGETEDYGFNVFQGIPCAGTPSMGTVTTPFDICPLSPFNITVDPVLESGIEYQWQSSPSGQNTWSDIVGATNSMYSESNGIINATDYRVIITCTNSNQSVTSPASAVDIAPAMDCYCIPTYDYGCSSDLISNVTLQGITTAINNTTGCSNGYYGDFTNLPAADLIPGMMYDLSVSTTYSAPQYEDVRAWIDWNQNGVFEPSEEIYNTNGNGLPGGTVVQSFAVPTTVNPDNYIMRVRMVYSGGGNIDPCSNASFGETEDYTVTVANVANCSGTPAAAVASGPADVCPLSPFNLTGVGIAELGISYQWQSSPTGQNNWTDIAGATNYNHTLAGGITDETDFRLVTTCTNSNQSSNSNVVTVDISPAIDCYCEPFYDYGCDFGTYINSVVTTMAAVNVNNTNTGCAEIDAMGYTDYSATHEVNAAQALPVGITVTVGNYSGGVKVWVDWNQNGVFEPSELVTESTSTIPGGSSHSATFTVPSNAALGNTKMRVRVVESSTVFDPCNQAYYGEAEDYSFVVLQGVACAGTPIAGNINGLNAICPANAFDLDVDPVLESGIEYQWQSSPSGTNTWANMAGGTGIVQSFPAGINDDTDYRVIITCTNSNQSDTTSAHSVTINPPTSCYCTPQYSTACSVGDDLSNVKLAGETVTLDNPTGCSPNGYADFRGLVDEPDLLPGETYTIELSTTYGSPQFEDVRAWIDWNQNGIFDANEEIANSMGNGMAPGTYTETFTVPAGTPNGLYTMRARVVYSGGANIDPCAMAAYGEAQDYYILVGTLCDDPIVNLGPDVTICAGSSITLDAGNPGLEYEWSNNATTQTITVTQAGTYTVTVYDGDCSTTASITVTVQDLPIVDLGNDKTICDGDVITLDAGNQGADFLWSDNSTGQTLNVNQAGTYHVTVTEGTCSTSDTVNVNYYPEPTAGGIIVTEQGECTFTFSVDNPQHVDYFEWNFGDGSIPTIGPLASHTYTAEGQFTVTLTLKNECDDEVQFTYVVFCEGIGIDDLDAGKNAITLYPNPTTERITLESNNNAVMEAITVYNVLGQAVYENASVNATEHIVDVSKLASGVYTVRIQTNQGYVTRKFEIIK